jgi:hypothetical protein
VRLVFIVVPLYLLCCFCILFALLSFKLTPAGVDSHLSEIFFFKLILVINSLKIVKEKDEVQCGCAKKPCWKMVHSCLMH